MKTHRVSELSGVLPTPGEQPDKFVGDAEELRWLFDYNPVIGVFRHRNCLHADRIGKEVGHLDDDGYVRINATIGGIKRPWRAHRLAWLYVTGKWPVNEIDHRNRVRHDNRFENLRDVDDQGNRDNHTPQERKYGSIYIVRSTHTFAYQVTTPGGTVSKGRFATEFLARVAAAVFMMRVVPKPLRIKQRAHRRYASKNRIPLFAHSPICSQVPHWYADD